MFLISGLELNSIFDLLFHAWVIYYLVLGITAYYKLKNLPPEEETVLQCEDDVQVDEQNPEQDIAETSNSPIIRKADKDVKNRVLIEMRTLNYDICYRRVKHTNELVINGNVYDEFTSVVEPPHTLEASIDGHLIVVGFKGIHSFISLDGETVAKKVRIV